MTISASALPALPPNETGRPIVERLNALIRWFNRPDLFVPSYAADSGSGSAYVTAPSTDVKVYEIGQEFDFKATNANTSTAPTLAVNGLAAGVITKIGGSALALGDIPANSFNKVIVTSTTPTFQLLSPTAITPNVVTGATTFLGANQLLGTGGTWTNVINTGSIGGAGQTWLIMVNATGLCGGGQSFIGASIFNGTSRIITVEGVNPAANQDIPVSACIVVALTGATTFTLQGTASAVNTSFLTSPASVTGGAANTATSITAVRLA